MRTLPGLKKYGYCSPNTNLQKKLDANLNPKPGYEPINKVDVVCMRHNINYMLAAGKALKGGTKEVGTRHEADEIMLEELDKWKKKDSSWQEWFAKHLRNQLSD
jgi:hypothetical protein